MSMRTALAAIAVAVALIAYYLHDGPPRTPPSNGRKPISNTAERGGVVNHGTLSKTADGNDYHEAPGYFIPVTGGKPRQRAPADPFSTIQKTRSGLPLNDDPFVAQSIQEQQWLDRNGYPNAQQWSAYSNASEVMLEAAAAHGDDVASVMLAARQLSRGDMQASGRLMTAGANGSNFALSLLSAYLVNGKNGNPELGYAISRVMELRGDWRAGVMRDTMYRTPLSAEQKMQAEEQALKILGNLSKGGEPQLHVDARPLPPQQG